MPPTIRTIVLTGFMGAGKSTIGGMLARTLGWEFLDADTVIEARAGKTVAEIFAQHGEEVFRALEVEAIVEVVREHAGRRNLVLALGGGAVETEAIRKLFAAHRHACLVFLDAPLEVLVARCLAQPAAAERPVLADRDRLLRRFNERLPYYRGAHLTISTAGLSPGEVVARIMDVLGQHCETAPAQRTAASQ
ncbi:MAG TPA: shikimate kinase [Acidobacteriaceae bacterium]|nr:shikimate kinase [Acidobacteriaceae bacterium]